MGCFSRPRTVKEQCDAQSTCGATPPYAEDASRLRAGSAPRLFASIASFAVSVLNRAGLTNHAAARRALGWDRTGLQVLGLLGL